MTATSALIETNANTGLATWNIDADHSEVGFAVKHLMFATVKGNFRRFSGRIVLDEANLAASTIEAEIEVASIDTRQDQRDTHLRSADFFDADNHPLMTFRSTKIEKLRHGYYRAIGLLTIRGQSNEVVLDVEETGRGTDPWGGERIGYSARTTIDRAAFGLTWNQALEAGGVMVGNDVRISLEVETVKA
ncbi:MAG TPA: YceI family protein [Woeseiaceae bacterium]